MAITQKACIRKIVLFADTYNLLPVRSHILIGLSGGSDSVFLLHVLHALRAERIFKLSAAHLNHEWRPEASDDLLFCKTMCDQLAVDFYEGRLSTLNPPIPYQGSREAQGRIARRNFLKKIRQEINADSIALAHHADDQEETFFIRLIRGSSLTGLVGMRPRAGIFIRPLLSLYKQEITQFLTTHTIPYRYDSSNEAPEFLRNRIRMHVIPTLRSIDVRFDRSFAHTHTQLQRTEELLHKLTIEQFSLIATQQGSQLIIDRAAFNALHPVLQERILVHWFCVEKISFPSTYAFLQEVQRFLKSTHTGTHTLTRHWSLIKQAKLLTITHHP
jgi:tRNA(Ile)-lysidine synthase